MFTSLSNQPHHDLKRLRVKLRDKYNNTNGVPSMSKEQFRDIWEDLGPHVLSSFRRIEQFTVEIEGYKTFVGNMPNGPQGRLSLQDAA